MFHNIRFKKHLTTFQSIFLGFFLIIIIGSLLLMLPISSVSGKVTPFNESLFTATSAVCVTGLVVQDTGSYCGAQDRRYRSSYRLRFKSYAYFRIKRRCNNDACSLQGLWDQRSLACCFSFDFGFLQCRI